MSGEVPNVPKHLLLSDEDYKAIQAIYDTNKNGSVDDHEIIQLISDYNNKKIDNPTIIAILKKYDGDKDGYIDVDELKLVRDAFRLQESQFRAAAYTPLFARLFRYLAFTSDFGEALRPVMHRSIVTGTYVVAFGYCVADIAIEANKLKTNNYINDHGEKISMAHCLAERTTFQAIASLVGPALIIHQTVHFAKAAFAKLGKFTKWGPSIVGLSVIPFLPIVLDEPVEHGVHTFYRDYVFKNKEGDAKKHD